MIMDLLFFCTVDVPDWGIAVVVVGVLALIALVFCFMGVAFACQNNRKSEGGEKGRDWES